MMDDAAIGFGCLIQKQPHATVFFEDAKNMESLWCVNLQLLAAGFARP
jgi:hypothetical protein